MNDNMIGFAVVIGVLIVALLWMLYFQYVDGYVRQYRSEQENVSYAITTDTVPTTTWILEAKFRELSDEEIKRVFAETTGFDFDDNPGDSMALMDFAHAVVRRAQER